MDKEERGRKQRRWRESLWFWEICFTTPTAPANLLAYFPRKYGHHQRACVTSYWLFNSRISCISPTNGALSTIGKPFANKIRWKALHWSQSLFGRKLPMLWRESLETLHSKKKDSLTLSKGHLKHFRWWSQTCCMAAKELGTDGTYIFVDLISISTNKSPLGLSVFKIRTPGAFLLRVTGDLGLEFFLVSSPVMVKRKGKVLTPNHYGPTFKIIQQVHKYHQSFCSLLFLKKHTRKIKIRITLLHRGGSL